MPKVICAKYEPVRNMEETDRSGRNGNGCRRCRQAVRAGDVGQGKACSTNLDNSADALLKRAVGFFLGHGFGTHVTIVVETLFKSGADGELSTQSALQGLAEHMSGRMEEDGSTTAFVVLRRAHGLQNTAQK